MKTFPNGLLKAVTFSYDDGNLADERLVALFNQYGLKGTFNLCSGFCQREDCVPAHRIGELYKGHEVALHTVTHPNLVDIPADRAHREVAEDMATLSDLAGYPVRGMAYPYGGFIDEVIALLAEEGVRYSRTTLGTGGFSLPTQPLTWHPTCHHHTAEECMERFLAAEATEPMLLYIWGHSYEFDREGTWAQMEAICRRLAEAKDVWKATNSEILDAMA
ncbi:MAG: polysaccharide deacetylase family protein [Clostridia bacterium]|nr:polysaccharide deacetylase family protein [Clostridia bacterium]